MAETDAATVVISRTVPTGREIEYRTWHHEVTGAARAAGGFLEANLFEPVAGVQDEWVQVTRFDSPEHVRAWLDSTPCREWQKKADAAFGPGSRQVVVGGKGGTIPVTVVVSQLLKPGYADAYQKWQIEIDAAARKYPGFLGTEMIKPVPKVQNEWVVIFRFDSAEHLEQWFASDVHKGFMARAEPFFERVQVRRMGSGFGDWFANASPGGGTQTPQWKMAMVVLMTLYPLVMLLTLWVSPLESRLPMPVSMFLGNVLSVGLLTWPIMPLTTRAFQFWLDPQRSSGKRVAYGGMLLVLLVYAASIALFLIV